MSAATKSRPGARGARPAPGWEPLDLVGPSAGLAAEAIRRTLLGAFVDPAAVAANLRALLLANVWPIALYSEES